jgi:hypothetical protein
MLVLSWNWGQYIPISPHIWWAEHVETIQMDPWWPSSIHQMFWPIAHSSSKRLTGGTCLRRSHWMGLAMAVIAWQFQRCNWKRNV